jgi:hypothetical protein
VLARLECIKPAAFQAALEQLTPDISARTPTMALISDEKTGHPTSQETPTPGQPDSHRDARGFLLSVMNDKTVELHLRIEAAKALLLR